jgi:uncharacterized protein
MKLQPDRSTAPTVTGIGPGWVAVDGDRIGHSLIIVSGGQRIDWPAGRFEDLDATHFETLSRLEVEVVIFGSGSRLRFPPHAWIAPLARRRIGIETMDTAAACRTYNILAQEGRTVAAALLVEAAG